MENLIRDKLSKSKTGKKRSDMSCEKNIKSKLNLEKVHDIRKKYLSGKFCANDLAIQYGVTEGTILFIINNKTWKDENYAIHLDYVEKIKKYHKYVSFDNNRYKRDNCGENNPRSKLTWKIVNEIRIEYEKNGFSSTCKKYSNIPKSTICKIIYKQTWKEQKI